MTTREWLLQNGYGNIDRLIGEVAKRWKESGVGTRRNWWEVLAGHVDGTSITIEGIEFPVLVVAQLHQGRKITANAIQRKPGEKPPKKSYHGRSIPKAKRRRGKKKVASANPR